MCHSVSTIQCINSNAVRLCAKNVGGAAASKEERPSFAAAAATTVLQQHIMGWCKISFLDEDRSECACVSQLSASRQLS